MTLVNVIYLLFLTEYGAPTEADAEWADGIIFGTPTPFGNTSAELKAFIDSLGSLWFHGKLNGKAAGAFTSTEDHTAGMRRRCSLFTSRWRIWG
jgi:multimeric flavodoxin WrbA